MGRLDGKVAIVTGVGPNIGRAVAVGLAREGAKVGVNHRRAEAAQSTVDIIRRNGGDAIPVIADVTVEDAVRAGVQQVVDHWGRVDILVNNQSNINPKGVLDMPYAEFKTQMAAMVDGTFLFTKYAAQAMVERRIQGSIINVITCAAWQGEPGNIGYCTAKGGILNFTRSAAIELAQHGIRVNNVTPTATQPEDEEVIALRRARAGSRPPRRFTMDFDGIPMGRRPTPSDYVPAFVYLASDDSRMVTGANLTVDGGALAKYWAWAPPKAGVA